MYTPIGTCPHCGAPVYTRSVYQSVLPPTPYYVCDCRLRAFGDEPQFITTTSASSSFTAQVQQARRARAEMRH